MPEPIPFPKPATGPEAVKAAIDNAAPVPPTIEDAEKERHGGPGQGLPPDCPVTALGMSADGKRFFYLDAGQRFCELAQKDHSRLGILALFNERYAVLLDYWPRLTKVTDSKTGETDWQVTGWKPERAAEELIAACGRRGTLNAADKVRGAGAWRGPDGELILHCGDRVLWPRNGQARWEKPGDLAGAIYAANARTPLPADQYAPGGPAGPGQWVLDIFKSWDWQRPETDPHLLLGMVGAMMVGGALTWRPLAWITGEFNTGKSTLMRYVSALLGDGGHYKTAETSPAGIWQTTRQSTLPIIIDEAEAENDPRKMAAVIKLARIASSGDVVFRGGDQHSPIRFVIQCCFLFGSILIPALTPQDRSRIAVLALNSLTTTKPPDATPAKLKTAGELLRRRMLDGWPRLDATFDRYRGALIASGHGIRSADQYGILLACADVLLHDHNEAHTDELDLWCERLPPEREASKDHQNCIAHLLTAPIDPFRSGGRKTVAQWIEDACRPANIDHPDPIVDANRALETYGLSVEVIEQVTRGPDGLVDRHKLRFLYIANTHRGLSQLFEGSHWSGQSGTTAPWVQAVRRVPGAEPCPGRRFAGYKARATRLPLDYLLDNDDGE